MCWSTGIPTRVCLHYIGFVSLLDCSCNVLYTCNLFRCSIRSAITPPSSGSSPPAPAPVQRIVSRVKTPPPPPKVQISNQQPVSMPSKLPSVNALDTKSGSSIDDLVRYCLHLLFVAIRYFAIQLCINLILQNSK